MDTSISTISESPYPDLGSQNGDLDRRVTRSTLEIWDIWVDPETRVISVERVNLPNAMAEGETDNRGPRE